MQLTKVITHQLEDRSRYNTVYAAHEGSAAAPTAGLHFTPKLLKEIQEKGVDIARVTLHVGLGTFRPVKVEDVTEHHMHSEFYMVDAEAAEKINKAKEHGGRVICVGTTSCRTIESAADENGRLKPCSGWTEIFIYPGYQFKILDGLITNFHLPESTLIMLVSALAGKEHVMAAYEEAVTSCRTGHIPPGESGGGDRAPYAFGVLHGGCRSGREDQQSQRTWRPCDMCGNNELPYHRICGGRERTLKALQRLDRNFYLSGISV